MPLGLGSADLAWTLKQEFWSFSNQSQKKAVLPVLKTDGQKEVRGMRYFNGVSPLLQALLHSVLILLDAHEFHLNFFAIIPNLDLLYRASIDSESLIIQFVGILILVYQ